MGNVDFCPPLAWLRTLLALRGYGQGIKIRRSPEHGGNVSYLNCRELESDFASGRLHPGDLNPVVSEMLNETLRSLHHGLARSEPLQEALRILESHVASK